MQTAIKALKKRTDNHGGTTGKGEPTKKRVGFASASFPMDGSTATVLLRVGNKLFVANCGDSAGEAWYYSPVLFAPAKRLWLVYNL